VRHRIFTYERPAVSTATLERPSTTGTMLACPHCKKQFAPAVDATQPPRLQGAKCPNCKLFVPARVVAAAFDA
jgi:DNA-directed RNA polymerase subunit RPC12/RpoP